MGWFEKQPIPGIIYLVAEQGQEEAEMDPVRQYPKISSFMSSHGLRALMQTLSCQRFFSGLCFRAKHLIPSFKSARFGDLPGPLYDRWCTKQISS